MAYGLSADSVGAVRPAVSRASSPADSVAATEPVGSVVSADYSPTEDVAIGDTERDDIATGLAASAALEVKQSIPDDTSPTAQ